MLEDLKDRVRAVALKAQRDGLCKHKSGNFSMRDAASGLVVVTPTGVDRELLRADDMVVMDMHAAVVENATGLRPTSECLMHLAIYDERPDVLAVAHTHSLYATVFAVLGRPVPAIVYELQHLRCSKARVPVAPYARPGTAAVGESVRAAATEADAFLLGGHGAVAVDEVDVEGAYLKAQYLEELCQLYHLALSANGGKEPPAFPPEELQKWAYPSEITFPNG